MFCVIRCLVELKVLEPILFIKSIVMCGTKKLGWYNVVFLVPLMYRNKVSSRLGGAIVWTIMKQRYVYLNLWQKPVMALPIGPCHYR